MNGNTQQIVVFLVIGLVAGWLASFIIGGGGLIQYLFSGVIGAFVGGFLLSAVGLNLGIKNALLSQIVQATIGAIVVVLVARLIA
ncbi:MAG: GlsB/YeaQ/YmgE family stress response membrane protein [Pseudomonadota bacterium]